MKGINEKLAGLLAIDKNDRKRLKAEHMQSVRQAKGAKLTAASHSRHAKNMSKQDVSLLDTACPKCNGKLTVKTGRYGKFYGCSHYPSCRYTKKVKFDRQSV